MDISEVKRRRDKLAGEIGEMITAFQSETGVVIDKVEVEHLLTDERETPYKTIVGLKIELEPS